MTHFKPICKECWSDLIVTKTTIGTTRFDCPNDRCERTIWLAEWELIIKL